MSKLFDAWLSSSTGHQFGMMQKLLALITGVGLREGRVKQTEKPKQDPQRALFYVKKATDRRKRRNEKRLKTWTGLRAIPRD